MMTKIIIPMTCNKPEHRRSYKFSVCYECYKSLYCQLAAANDTIKILTDEIDELHQASRDFVSERDYLEKAHLDTIKAMREALEEISTYYFAPGYWAEDINKVRGLARKALKDGEPPRKELTMSGKCNACGSDLCPICGGCCVEGECGCYPVPDCKNCTELAAANDTIKALREDWIKVYEMCSFIAAEMGMFHNTEDPTWEDELVKLNGIVSGIAKQALKDGER